MCHQDFAGDSIVPASRSVGRGHIPTTIRIWAFSSPSTFVLFIEVRFRPMHVRAQERAKEAELLKAEKEQLKAEAAQAREDQRKMMEDQHKLLQELMMQQKALREEAGTFAKEVRACSTPPPSPPRLLPPRRTPPAQPQTPIGSSRGSAPAGRVPVSLHRFAVCDQPRQTLQLQCRRLVQFRV